MKLLYYDTDLPYQIFCEVYGYTYDVYLVPRLCIPYAHELLHVCNGRRAVPNCPQLGVDTFLTVEQVNRDCFMRCAAPVSSSEMVVLRCSDVPLYLRDSDFYRNLDKGDDEEFELSLDHFKRDTTVRNDSDLDHLLSTLRFWGSVCFPETAIVFIIHCSQEMLGYILKKYGDELSIISSIDTVSKSEPSQKMNKAIEGGNLALVQFLLREGHNFNTESAELAAKAGSVPILKYMHENGHCIESSASKGAAELGHMHCLQYLRSINIPWHKNVGVIAAACGHLACLKYVVEHGHEIIDKDHACIYAAQNGLYECLQYLVDQNLHASAEYWIRCAAYSGNLPCLQLAYNLTNTWPTGDYHPTKR